MATDTRPVLEITGLTKRFFGILALDDVGMSVSAGEIHALVGENGAGKSTLIKILAGVHAPDAGRIRLGGSDVHPHLHKLPLSFVHQDLGLVDDLSVGENVALVAGFPRWAGLIDWGRVWRRAVEIYQAMEVVPPDPRMPVGGLSAASKAVLGIVRALSRHAQVVVLDEPTASLPEPDAQHLFDVLRRLRATGTGIIYVTHRLNELFGFADRITVLRDGRHVRTAPTSDMTPASLVQDMLGRPIETMHVPHLAAPSAAPVVQVSDLRIAGIGPLSFAVAPGEIVGLVGLQGAGHEMIGRAIFGAMRPHGGEIRLDGAVLPPEDGIHGRIAKGIALLAGDRGRENALPGMSVMENLLPNPAIVRADPWRPVSPGAERRRTAATLARLDVRPPDPAALIEWLSGGNQQKVFVGRWLASNARLYVMEEPTAGVDIGAKFAIHTLLRDAADKGAAILVVSSDFEEVATLCDRALVISRGQIAGELHGAALTVDNVLARASLGAGHVAA